MTVFLAGLQAIPRDYLDAARVDGAGAWRRFRTITLPLLKPVTLFVFVTGIISSDRKSTRLNSSHVRISYAVFCLKKKKSEHIQPSVGLSLQPVSAWRPSTVPDPNKCDASVHSAEQR